MLGINVKVTEYVHARIRWIWIKCGMQIGLNFRNITKVMILSAELTEMKVCTAICRET